jgi:hypothetical protein
VTGERLEVRSRTAGVTMMPGMNPTVKCWPSRPATRARRCRAPADVETVIVGGDVVKRAGQLTGDLPAQALELMHATRRHLRA